MEVCRYVCVYPAATPQNLRSTKFPRHIHVYSTPLIFLALYISYSLPGPQAASQKLCISSSNMDLMVEQDLFIVCVWVGIHAYGTVRCAFITGM